MTLTGKIINISSTNANGSTPVGINGRHRTLLHNVDVAVSDAELEVLENSHVAFEVKGDADAADLAQAVDAGGGDTGASEGQPAGADYLATAQPDPAALAVHMVRPVDETVAGADHLEPVSEADEDAARQDALDAQQASLDGTTEPVVVLTNNDPNQTGAASEVPSVEVEQLLEQSVPQVLEDLADASPERLRSVLEAEKAGQNRATLVAPLESRLASS